MCFKKSSELILEVGHRVGSERQCNLLFKKPLCQSSVINAM